ncbi:hypothetical protein Dda_3189 [Drechslerella dactyloides]|uniref:YT521-B-like splicing factor n=1 Tax=Drechslerella dactyloides TaxID=74499 RepID=A0AAD6J5B1_DREDA|nr:hypothetical protein Dda_3189 [Drechslerella dactyloides]
MGDAHPRSHRRSLIVSSTTATEIKQKIEGPELLNKTLSTASDSTATVSTNSPTMYGPTIAMLPQAQQYHHPHMPYVQQAAQPRYHQAPMHSHPAQQPFNMQPLQAPLQSYSLHGQQHGQQSRYGPVVSPPSVQYSVSPIQIPTVTTQPGQVHGMTQYYEYSQSPPGASHSFPGMNTYNPAYATPQATDANSQYPQWPQRGLPFLYLPQYGQQTGMMAVPPLEYSSYGPLQPSPNYIPRRRRSVPHTGHEAYEGQFVSQSPNAFDPMSGAAGQRQGSVPRHLMNSGSRQRRGSPVPSSYSNGRSSSIPGHTLTAAGVPSMASRSPQSALHPVLPRGPPRKPRQSGHALWVGNLPAGTTVSALKDYFATEQIESVFLISKSNCAFVNYKTEAACNDAMRKFHDSRFQGVRLVCRLRRTSSTGDASETDGTLDASVTTAPATEISDSAEANPESEGAPEADTPVKPREIGFTTKKAKERYFIVKSLTLEDLDTSVSNGIWATQTHNELALNEAFLSAENVFLIFSANKSGEYYGYARMASEISDEVASKIEWAPMTQSIDEIALPKAIYTPPTATAPRGRIIDDSSRGTIFWEVIEDSDSEDESPPVEGTTISKSWGRPFRVEWISTFKVPFYRTRGLRNPYNVSREVKIARDGTEIEPGVGRKLLQMFHRGGPLPFDADHAAPATEAQENGTEIETPETPAA